MDQIALGAIHSESDGLTWASRNFQRLSHIIDHHFVIIARLVDRHFDIAGGHAQSFNASKVGTFRTGFETDPASCAFFLIDQSQGKVHSAQLQTEGIRTSTIESGKGIHIGSADGQEVDFHFVAIR